MTKFTKEQILEAIAKIKDVNVWAISDNVQLTFDHETEMVIVWSGDGDYDAHYKETNVDGILTEAHFIEAHMADAV